MINILLLGEIGVGKSTWINGFVNYLTYDSLEEAVQGRSISVIPAMFTVTDSHKKEHWITYDVNNDAESTIPIPGQSTTQIPKTYLINMGYVKIRIIDTPGIGDVRGIEKDRENMENILAHLSQYEELNGIIILMRRNNSNMNVKFLFCLKELLSHLHRDAHKNILFCFTHARNTNKRPSNTMLALKDFLTRNASIGIRMTRATVYCIDSDCIRFLMAMKSIEYDDNKREEYAACWKNGVNESMRLICHISFLVPHSIQKTVSINDVRRFITEQRGPMAPIANIIQTCIAAIEDKQAEAIDTDSTKEDLQKRLRLPTIHLKTINFDSPRTVCTWPKCISLISSGPDGRKKTYCKTICHDPCNDVTADKNVIRCEELQQCIVMDQSGKCQVCSCNWANHIWITYETALEIEWVEDEGIMKLIEEEVGLEEAIREHQNQLNDKLKQLNYEKNRLTEVISCFRYFLEHNSIYTYNDELPDYMDYLIEDKRMKAGVSSSSKTLFGLTNLKRIYLEEIEAIEEAMARKRDFVDNIDEKKIKELMSELEELSNIGAMIEYINGKVREKDETFKTLSESVIHLPRESKIMLQLKEKIKNRREIIDLGVNEESRTINILLLGETGVGKSTWINGFVNYLTYESLEEAERGEPVILIPAMFTVTDSNFKEHRITYGVDGDTNESSQIYGHSATEMSKSYLFDLERVKIRIIDTPGIGDVRGIEKDKERMENIMAYLSQHGEINGIIILMKPNNSRLNVMFEFCIKELLTHLHKDACENILICFTNARGTNYRPGEAMPSLKKLLKKNKITDIKLNRDTVYCMDNESVRYLMTMRTIGFDESEREEYTISWRKAVDESMRMISHISHLRPHSTQKTLSINEVRRSIIEQSRPMAGITKAIQTNIDAIKDKQEEAISVERSKAELQKKLTVPIVQLKRIDLDRTRTVCTAPSCVSFSSVGEIQQIHYKTICHDNCNGVASDKNTIRCVELQKCWAMDQSTGKCRVCSCGWDTHMYITYDSVLETVMVEDEGIKKLIDEKEGSLKAIREHQKQMEDKLRQLQREKERLAEINASFVCFLKHNSIAPYNDCLVEYLSHLIENERMKVGVGVSQRTLEGLVSLKRVYQAEIESIEKANQKETGTVDSLDEKRINELISELKELPIVGAMMKDVMAKVSEAKDTAIKLSDKVIVLPRQSKRMTKM